MIQNRRNGDDSDDDEVIEEYTDDDEEGEVEYIYEEGEEEEEEGEVEYVTEEEEDDKEEIEDDDDKEEEEEEEGEFEYVEVFEEKDIDIPTEESVEKNQDSKKEVKKHVHIENDERKLLSEASQDSENNSSVFSSVKELNEEIMEKEEDKKYLEFNIQNLQHLNRNEIISYAKKVLFEPDLPFKEQKKKEKIKRKDILRQNRFQMNQEIEEEEEYRDVIDESDDVYNERYKMDETTDSMRYIGKNDPLERVINLSSSENIGKKFSSNKIIPEPGILVDDYDSFIQNKVNEKKDIAKLTKENSYSFISILSKKNKMNTITGLTIPF